MFRQHFSCLWKKICSLHENKVRSSESRYRTSRVERIECECSELKVDLDRSEQLTWFEGAELSCIVTLLSIFGVLWTFPLHLDVDSSVCFVPGCRWRDRSRRSYRSEGTSPNTSPPRSKLPLLT